MKVAVGIGCRKNCPADAIEALARQALGRVADAAPLGIFTIADKSGEPGLIDAAGRLGLELVYLGREALKARETDTQSRSAHAETLFGVASVAEAAALVGAGENSVLIVPRIAEGGVTCAVARATP